MNTGEITIKEETVVLPDNDTEDYITLDPIFPKLIGEHHQTPSISSSADENSREDLSKFISEHDETPCTSPSEDIPSNLDDGCEATHSRKRTRTPAQWKQNIRKAKRERGELYTDVNGRTHLARKVQKGCEEKCRYKCSALINKDERQAIHDSFWKLSDDEKLQFYSKFVVREPVKQKRSLESCKRVFSFYYYFEIENKVIRVCKEFFLKTLDISHRRITYFFEHIYDSETGIARPSNKGKNVKRRTSEDDLKKVRDHINSFPRIECHYCRANTNKEYLESNLSLIAMYNLYRETVPKPVKDNIYRKVFNTEFNISFHTPKRDKCGI